MIEVVKIEDFVINQLFKPYTPSLIPHERYGKDKTKMKQMEIKLKKNPEKIMEILDNDQETKRRAFNRLRKFGGVKWYRYLDMSNPVIRWVNENLEEMEDEG